MSYRTLSANASTVRQEWYVVDATNQVVGRLASRVALVLRGKHKASYTPHVACGDRVIIVNAEKVRFTGKKLTDKNYYRYTGFPGGKRVSHPQELLRRKPIAVLEHAIRGMLPKTRLGREIFRSQLYVYAGPEHPHAAQQPRELNMNQK